jgi:subtilisin inhibitor-like
MRRLLCLVTAGLFLLSGTAGAVTEPPPDEFDPSSERPVPPYPERPVGNGPVSSAVEPSPTVKTLTLTIAKGERSAPVVGHALLQCDPPGGTHPDPEWACEVLEEVGGHPADLVPPRGVICTLQYDPVTVSATGIWNDEFIRFERTFGNACSLWAGTGPVFAFRDSWGWSPKGSWRPWRPRHRSNAGATGTARTTTAAETTGAAAAAGAAKRSNH